MTGGAAGRASLAGALILAVGAAGCNLRAGQAEKPVVATPAAPEPTMAQARDIATSGIAAIAGGYRVSLAEDGSGWAWRDGASGSVPVAWTVQDSGKTTLHRKAEPDPSGAGSPPPGQPMETGKPAICIELHRSADAPMGHRQCILARDWKTQPRAASSQPPAPKPGSAGPSQN